MCIYIYIICAYYIYIYIYYRYIYIYTTYIIDNITYKCNASLAEFENAVEPLCHRPPIWKWFIQPTQSAKFGMIHDFVFLPNSGYKTNHCYSWILCRIRKIMILYNYANLWYWIVRIMRFNHGNLEYICTNSRLVATIMAQVTTARVGGVVDEFRHAG